MLKFLILTMFLLLPPLLSASFPDHFLKPSKHLSSAHKAPQEYLELALPPLSDRWASSCAHPIIHHSFANTINKPPFSTPYVPPHDCPPPWAHVTLEFNASSRGDQYDRISGLWLGGAELLRTSTAEPTPDGIFWKVRKDITRYSSLLTKKNLNITVKLDNIVNNVYTGIYHVHVTFYFYKYDAVNLQVDNENLLRTLVSQPAKTRDDLLYEQPADRVIPVSSINGREDGYWFVLQGEKDIRFKKVRFPQNTLRAVLELYVSFHGNDEFWYSNPPDSYIRANNITTARGGGSYREVYVTVDGVLVGSEVPFPVVFTGGINPLFWSPVVAIGAFDLPSYDLDLTPFLGMGLLDGKDHVIGIGVSESISYWLVDLNLHIWLDHGSPIVKGKTVILNNPTTVVKRREQFRGLDGSFNVKAKSGSKLVGWTISSFGNLTTTISHELNFRSSVRFQNNGTVKIVKQKVRSTREVRVLNGVGQVVNLKVIRRKYPLKVITETLPDNAKSKKKGAYVLLTNVSHAWVEKWAGNGGSGRVSNKQSSDGWMEVKDHDVLNGKANTNQSFIYRNEGFGCYVRSIAAVNGKLVGDNTSVACPSVM